MVHDPIARYRRLGRVDREMFAVGYDTRMYYVQVYPTDTAMSDMVPTAAGCIRCFGRRSHHLSSS